MLKGYVKLINICWATNQGYIAINFSQFFIRKDSSIAAHSLHKREVLGQSPMHGT